MVPAVSARGRSALVLLRFAVGGALCFAADRWLGDGPSLRVEVRDGADAPAVAQAIDEALLLELAEARGWPHTDAIVRGRLSALLAAVEADGPEDAIATAIDMGLHRRDPIARARLLGAARRALGREADDAPGAIELLRELALHPQAQIGAIHVRFDHERVACDDAAAASLGADALPWPWGWPRPEVAYALPRLRMRLGDAVADALATGSTGQWSDRLRGPLGCHRVRVRERSGGALRPWPHGLVTLLQSALARRHDAVVRRELARRQRDRTVAIEVVR